MISLNRNQLLGDKRSAEMLAPLPKDISLDRRATERSAPIPLVSVPCCKLGRRHRAGLDGGHTAMAVEASPVGSTSIPRGRDWPNRRQCRRWRSAPQIARPANYSDELYARALRPLVRFHSADPNIFYLYTMVDRGGVAYFVLDTAASPDLRTNHKLRASAYMERFDLHDEYKNDDWLDQIAAGKTYVNPTFEQDDYGDFLSATSPIYDSEGRYSGFVGVDFDLQYYFAQEARFRAIAINSLIAALIGSLIIGYLVARYYSAMHGSYAAALRHFNPRQPDGTAQSPRSHSRHRKVIGAASGEQCDAAR